MPAAVPYLMAAGLANSAYQGNANRKAMGKGGSYISNMTPQQQQIANQLQSIYQGQVASYQPFKSDMQTDYAQGISQMANPQTPQQTSDFYQQYFAPSDIANVKQNVIPGIREAYAGQSGYNSGSRPQNEANAWTQMGLQQMQNIGNMYQQGQNRSLQALQSMPQGISSEMQQFLMGLQSSNPALQGLQNLLSESMQSYQQAPGYQNQQNQSNPFMDAMSIMRLFNRKTKDVQPPPDMTGPYMQRDEWD